MRGTPGPFLEAAVRPTPGCRCPFVLLVRHSWEKDGSSEGPRLLPAPPRASGAVAWVAEAVGACGRAGMRAYGRAGGR